MTEKRVETYTYDEQGRLTKKEIRYADGGIYTDWEAPPYWDTTPVWVRPPYTVTSTGDIPGTVSSGGVTYNKTDHRGYL